MAQKPNHEQAMLLKRLLHKKQKTTYLIVQKSINGSTHPIELTGSLRQHWDRISERNLKGADTYILVNQADGLGRKTANITGVNAVFIDYDKGDWTANPIEKLLAKFPVKPHLIVESSRGNFHIYWLVKDVSVDVFTTIQKLLAEKFDADPKVCDLPRVMRLPGTLNWKRDKPFMAEIVYSAGKSAKPISGQLFCKQMFGTDANLFKSTYGEINPNAAVKVEAGKGQSMKAAIEKALQILPADDRRVWITAGMALNDWSPQDGLELYITWSQKSTKYDEAELHRQWQSFKPGGGIGIKTLFWLAKGQAQNDLANPSPPISTQLDLVAHFARTSMHVLRHCEQERCWYVFNDGRWEKSNKVARRVCMDYLRTLNGVAQVSGNEEHRDMVRRYQSHGCARDLLAAAESDESLSITEDAFDINADLLGVKLPDIEGAIDRYAVVSLVKDRKRLARPADMLFRVAGAAYAPQAECPLWLEFLDSITQGDSQLQDFLQLAVGYTLYGHTREQVMFIIYGQGGNGKGILTRTIYAAFGDYAVTMQSNLLKPGAINANSPSPALMKLKGKRLWSCSEVYKGMQIDEALTKQITGGDMVSSRQLYGEQTEFQPVGVLWLSVNDMPRVRHDDKGMWRRIVPIPLNAKFTGKNRDNTLEDRLKNELPGILNWCIEGARKYAKIGRLPIPKVIRELKATLRLDVDTVGNWIRHRCNKSQDRRLQSQPGYESYRQYMQAERKAMLNQKEFKAEMERQGFRHRASNQFNYYEGLALKAD